MPIVMNTNAAAATPTPTGAGVCNLFGDNTIGALGTKDALGQAWALTGYRARAAALALSTTSITPILTVALPASCPVGTRIIFEAKLTNTATAQTLTVTAKHGTANTSADGNVGNWALTAGTAAAGFGMIQLEVEYVTSSSVMATLRFFNGNNTNTGIAAAAQAFLMTGPTSVLTAQAFCGLYLTSSTANIVTVQTSTVSLWRPTA